MADRILRLLGNPGERKAMGSLAQQVAWEKFSCAAQLAAVEQLYGQLFACQPSSRFANILTSSRVRRRTAAAYQQMPR
jgi:hypothetical protein